MAEEAKKSRGAWFREMKSELKKSHLAQSEDRGQEHRYRAAVLPAHRRVHLDL